MLKNLLTAMILAVFIAPSAQAHTSLTSTTPSHGEIVETPLTEIVLTYGGQIEEGSHFELLTSSNEEIELTSINVANGVMTGTVAEPLKNGEYIVKWDSISEDGHPLNGKFFFTVNVAQQEAVKDTSVEAENEDTTNIDENTDISDEVNDTITGNSSSNTTLFIAVIVLVAIILISLIFLFARRKK